MVLCTADGMCWVEVDGGFLSSVLRLCWSAGPKRVVIGRRCPYHDPREEFDVIAVHQAGHRRFALVIAIALVGAFAFLVPAGPASAAGTGTMSGTITFEGATVATSLVFWPESGPAASAWSGVDGLYSVELEEGTYEVRARHPDDPGGLFSGNTWYISTVTVQADKKVVQNFAIPPLTTVSGTITRGGTPLTSGTIVFFDGDGNVHQQKNISESGQYSVSLFAGEYEVMVAEAYMIEYLRRIVPLTVAAGRTQVSNISLPALATLSGQVVSTTGTPVPASVNTYPLVINHDWQYETARQGWVVTSDGQLFAIDWGDVGEKQVIEVNRRSGQSLYTGRFYAGAGNLGSPTMAGAVTVTAAAQTDLGQIKLDTCGTV
ncbi:MAG: hypothetical protein FWD11_12265, partial [Micrococcales bacterium]|nr:hypothetical protein [Micrococcales bacterium]